METRHTIYKSKTGQHKGKWFVEVRCLDDDGECLGRKVRRFRTQLDAKRGREELEKELKKDVESEGAVTRGEKMIFADLCRIAEKDFLGPAVIREGQVRKGWRSHRRSTQYVIRTLESYFGKYRLNKINEERIVAYGLHRFDKGGVKYSTINRELAHLRKMLKFAVRKKWITDDVFADASEKLINQADENPREHLLLDAEESILLEFCYKAEREVTFDWKRQGVEKKITRTFETGTDEMTAIVLLGLDAGLRAGEIQQLEWGDVDFENRVITLRAETTKTLHSRRVPLTARVADELKKLPSYQSGQREPIDSQIFDLRYFRRAWLTAVRLAGITDLQFRDLRRTFAKRLEGLGIAFTVLQKIMGHTAKSVTGKHYLPATIEDVRAVADKLDARNGGDLKSESAVHAEPPISELEANGLIN